MKDPMIIYLNGTSSCGKSTIANALQKLIPNSYHLSADIFGEEFENTIDKSDPEYIRINSHYDKCLNQIKNASSKNEQEEGFKVLYKALNKDPLPFAFNSDLHMYEHLKELKKSVIIIDDLISTNYLFSYFLNSFKNYQGTIYMIKVDCDLKVLEKRERERGDRLPGMAVFWHKIAHENKHYDLVIDSSEESPEKCAEKILLLLTDEKNPQAFINNLKDKNE